MEVEVDVARWCWRRMEFELEISPQCGSNNSDCDLIFADSAIMELTCVCGEAECSGI